MNAPIDFDVSSQSPYSLVTFRDAPIGLTGSTTNSAAVRNTLRYRLNGKKCGEAAKTGDMEGRRGASVES